MQYRSILILSDGVVEVRDHISLHALSEYIHNLHWRGDQVTHLSVTPHPL